MRIAQAMFAWVNRWAKAMIAIYPVREHINFIIISEAELLLSLFSHHQHTSIASIDIDSNKSIFLIISLRIRDDDDSFSIALLTTSSFSTWNLEIVINVLLRLRASPLIVSWYSIPLHIWSGDFFIREWQCNYDLNNDKRSRRGRILFLLFFFPFLSISFYVVSFSVQIFLHFSSFILAGLDDVELLLHSFLLRSFFSFFSFSVSLNWISSLHHHNWLLHKKAWANKEEIDFFSPRDFWTVVSTQFKELDTFSSSHILLTILSLIFFFTETD